ncbi:MAG: ABC transporter ATP-binding protein [Candidatus Schekmanbacteria bacterium]|nr:ABC transporter ATP-binding protein [Candidatus Schekmanbacteria bacterium]
MPTLIKIQDLHKSYRLNGGQDVPVLKGLSLEVAEGELLAVVGASGAGKSTLLHVIGAIDRPSSGKVCYRDEDIFAKDEATLAAFRNRQMGFIFQFHHLLPEFSALENVMMPLLISRTDEKEARQRSHKLLEDVGLGSRLTHKPGELSGGEQQRVAFARALVNNPQLILADEPTGNLDSHTSNKVFRLMHELCHKKQTTFILVTHNDHLAAQADRILQLEDGRLSRKDEG